MSLIAIIVIAIGLAMDAFAVSVTSGLTIHRLQMASGTHSRRSELMQALVLAICFGFFQAAMPLLGWFLGIAARAWIEPVDHWIAFGLLFLIGGHMVLEGWRGGDDEESEPTNPMRPRTLILLGIATSIDALAVGISLAAIGVDIWQPALVIGLVTLVLSFIGTLIGDALGHLFEDKLAIIGGLLLIGIGVKILIDHLFLGPAPEPPVQATSFLAFL